MTQVQQLKNKFNTLKKKYTAYRLVINASGGGAVDALDDDAWKDLVTAHPDCAEFRNKVTRTYRK